MLAGQEHTLQINRHNVVPFFLARFNGVTISPYANIIVQDIDTAIRFNTTIGHILAI